jgi:hypothetical protein
MMNKFGGWSRWWRPWRRAQAGTEAASRAGMGRSSRGVSGRWATEARDEGDGMDERNGSVEFLEVARSGYVENTAPLLFTH